MVQKHSTPQRIKAGVLVILVSAGLSACATVDSSSGATIGLVLTQWRHALHETPNGQEECPDGFSVSEAAQHRAQDNSQQRREEFGYFLNRGRNGEHAAFMPWMVEDPLPSPELHTDIGYGLNLDGTLTGDASVNSCQHQKFTSASGDKVDNQLARVVGCTASWRTGGFAKIEATNEMPSNTDPIRNAIS